MLDKLTTKVATPPSKTTGLLIETVGAPSSSIIVAVPDEVVFAVFPEIAVPFKVNVSGPSFIVSCNVFTDTVAVV